MPNSWSRQAYVKGFDCESITLKSDVNMFECTEIAESIYEGALLLLLLLLLLERSPCIQGVQILGKWCSTLCTEAKETLDSVPIWFSFLLYIHCCCNRSGGIDF